ncbi:YkvI family membrane protein [Litchfieldia salsa]|uniref:Uncharacterized membrane protein YkvI n=1 Tax=Litchfieldia salsa TaxID=930152 RepID=A0A1H0RYT5_9BACI|nr:hypothetical protein [Litchfieldia salsa]SDP34489.1 Uncharacterized membrane protein YkvI [Litchfieldia salsa]
MRGVYTINHWKETFQVAAVYVGTVVGAGFATGREIVEFFTQYGIYGLIGIFISGTLFMWLGSKMMIISKEIRAESYKEFNEYLFGRKIGGIINVLMLIVLIGVTSVMLSGAGAVFKEQLGLPYQTGIFVTIILAIAVLIFGVKGLFSVNMVVVPLLIIFSTILALKVVISGDFSLFKQGFEPISHYNWLVSPFTYTAFNLAMAQAVLVPLAKEVKNVSSITWGGILGGAALCLILVSSHVALSSIPNVMHLEIPMADVMRTTLFSLHWLYVFVIYGEIFTSVIGDIFGLQRQLKPILRVPNIVIIIGILSIAYVISLLGYGSLISVLYPIFGYMSLALLVSLMIPTSIFVQLFHK